VPIIKKKYVTNNKGQQTE